MANSRWGLTQDEQATLNRYLRGGKFQLESPLIGVISFVGPALVSGRVQTMAATAPKYNILVDHAIWGVPPQDMPSAPAERLRWYQQAMAILLSIQQDASVSWKPEDIRFAQERTQQRITILERIAADAAEKTVRQSREGSKC